MNKTNIQIATRGGYKWQSGTPCVLCLGNFDGVHIGHRALLAGALEQKQRLMQAYPDIICGAVTFRELTHSALSTVPTPRITDSDEKNKLFFGMGLDVSITLDFESVRNMTPAEFVSDILKAQCNCVMTVCGFNFRFGAGGVGNHDTLLQLMNGNSVTVAPITVDGITVSSTAIRTAVESGDMESANKMLGRQFSIEATVNHGRGVGNKLGFATLNQNLKPGHLVPALGVYASSCDIDGVLFPAVSNIGTHPTFGDGADVVCETHIIGFCGDLYGKHVKTRLYKFLRPERKFDSPEQLTQTVMHNIEQAKQYFEENIKASQ